MMENMSTKKFVIVFIILNALVFGLYAQKYQDTIMVSDFYKSDLQNERVGFKNTGISLLIPKNFIEFSSEQHSGFMSAATGASIVAFEYHDTPYIGYYEIIADEVFSEVHNAVFLGKNTAVTHSGMPAAYYFYSFVMNNGVKANRIIMFTGDEQKMVFVQANYPLMFEALLKESIIQSFLTVEFE